jgi:preprotein translocase subunit SecG
MITGLLIAHVIICVLLIVVVLLQFGKGAEAGAIMGGGGGGGSQNVFTSSSKGNFFTKMTTFLAIAFMVNSIALSLVKSKGAKDSIFDDEAPVAKALNNDAAKAKAATQAPAKTEDKKAKK